jgi:hypothetical protein
MSQYIETNTKAFVASEEIPMDRLVTIDGNGKIALASATSAIAGISARPTFKNNDVITVRLRTASGTAKLVANGAITSGAAVFAAALGKVSAAGTVFVGTALETATANNDVIEVLPGPNTDILASAGSVQQTRTRVTTAQVNAGHSLLPAVAGRSYRLLDCVMIAIGGNASGATAVRLNGTQAASVVQLVSNTAAALTQNTRVQAGVTTDSSILADGASFVANDANTPITIDKDGSALATATHIDVLLTYVLN